MPLTHRDEGDKREREVHQNSTDSLWQIILIIIPFIPFTPVNFYLFESLTKARSLA